MGQKLRHKIADVSAVTVIASAVIAFATCFFKSPPAQAATLIATLIAVVAFGVFYAAERR